jgi:hypothetical protein
MSSAAFMLRGRVILNDGKKVPERARLSLGFDQGRTSRSSPLDADGWFEFSGVLTGAVSLQIQIPGYRISAKNPSKDWVNEGRLVGLLQQSHEQFFIELEPANAPAPSPPATHRTPTDQPLRSAQVE